MQIVGFSMRQLILCVLYCRGNKFTNYSKNKVLLDISELTIWLLYAIEFLNFRLYDDGNVFFFYIYIHVYINYSTAKVCLNEVE